MGCSYQSEQHHRSEVAVFSRYGAVVARSQEEAVSIASSCRLPKHCEAPDQWRALVQTGGQMGLGASWSEPTSLLHISNEPVFDLCIVSQAIRMFDSPFTTALLRHLCQLLREKGVLLLPVKQSHSAVLLDPKRLDELMSCEGAEFGDYRLYRRPRVPRIRSVLAWYLENHARLVYEQVLRGLGVVDCNLDAIFERCIMDVSSKFPHTTVAARERGRSKIPRTAIEQLLVQVVSEHGYFVNGLQYKAPIVADIIRQYFPREKPLRIVDVGGGPGALAAELLLNPQLSIAFALVRDPSMDNAIFLRQLCGAFHEPLEGHLFFSVGTGDDFQFPKQIDVVLFIGSLLYVSTQRRSAVLENAWEALNRGGLLLVHENIRAPSYVRDYDKMFEPDELESVLRRFGPIHHYLSTAIGRIAADKVSRKTVFRVVQKA